MIRAKLKSKRLVLRPVLKSDANRMYELRASPDVASYAGIPPRQTIQRVKKYVRDVASEWRQKQQPRRMVFSILLRETGDWIGGITVRWPHEGVGEIAYSILPRYWGQGYATEAVREILKWTFKKYGAHRIQATSWVKNYRSHKVLEKNGFSKEGLLRGFLKRGSQIRDEFIFGMTRRDWQA